MPTARGSSNCGNTLFQSSSTAENLKKPHLVSYLHEIKMFIFFIYNYVSMFHNQYPAIYGLDLTWFDSNSNYLDLNKNYLILSTKK